MRTVSILINAAIFLTTLVLIVLGFRRDGVWDVKRGLKAFRFFTVLSNVFCAMAALGMVFSASGTALLFKYLGTVSVTVTLLTVVFFLGPTQGGYAMLFSGENLYMHLIGPLLAILSYGFLEKRDMSFGTALLGMVPVALYGVMYLYRVVLAPEEKRWEDFYGFNRGGKWPVAFSGMLLMTLAVCLVIWRV